MEWYDFYDIAERYIELINPLSAEKVVQAGRSLHLSSDSRVIDFGCGYAEALALWTEEFGVKGIGVEVRDHAVDRARKKMIVRGLASSIQIIHADGAEYDFDNQAFDVASCMGASFIWKGFEPTLRALKTAIKSTGRILIGEPYWKNDQARSDYPGDEKIYTERELLDIMHRHGMNLEYLIRSSDDDWTHYEASNWQGLIAWLEEHPDHPEKDEVVKWFQKEQNDYFHFVRDHIGWAIYILKPIRY
jgi:SAM-dependent methyltransferase